MSHFARINAITKKVDAVIVADENFISSLPNYDLWIKTSYNMRGGVYHIDNVPAEDQSVIEGDEARQRKNYAGIGYSYDSTRDAFIPTQPYPSWTLNETTCLWDAPVAYPNDGNRYQWNEDTQTWDQVTES